MAGSFEFGFQQKQSGMDRQSTEEILIEYGIHLGYEGPRKELARDLEKGGLTDLDLRMVADHVRDSGGLESAGRRISAVLSDGNRWGPLLADLRRHHEYRNKKQARTVKRKVEPGKGLREQDQGHRDKGNAAYFGMTVDEVTHFKWQWTVADWRHSDYSEETVKKFMGASASEQTESLEMFPHAQSYDKALAEHAGTEGMEDDTST